MAQKKNLARAQSKHAADPGGQLGDAVLEQTTIQNPVQAGLMPERFRDQCAEEMPVLRTFEEIP